MHLQVPKRYLWHMLLTTQEKYKRNSTDELQGITFLNFCQEDLQARHPVLGVDPVGEAASLLKFSFMEIYGFSMSLTLLFLGKHSDTFESFLLRKCPELTIFLSDEVAGFFSPKMPNCSQLVLIEMKSFNVFEIGMTPFVLLYFLSDEMAEYYSFNVFEIRRTPIFPASFLKIWV